MGNRFIIISDVKILFTEVISVSVNPNNSKQFEVL